MAGTKNCWRCSGVASSLIVQLEYRPMVQHAIERTSGFGSLSELMRKFMRMGRCGSMPVMQPAGERTVHGRQQALGRTVESGGGRARKREGRTLGDGSEREDAALAVEPVGAEELLLEVGEEDLEHLDLERDGHDVERGRGALAQVPLGVGLLVLIVLVVVVVLVVLVLVFVVCSLARVPAGLRAVGPGGAGRVLEAVVRVRLGREEVGLDVGRLVRHGGVVLVRVEEEDVVLRVDHALDEDGDDLGEERAQVVDELGVLGEREPELARLERDLVVLDVLGRVQHEVDDVGHVRDEDVGPGREELDERLAHRLAHLGRVVRRVLEQPDDERLEVEREGVVVGRDELDRARQGVVADLGVRRVDVRQELGDHDVERSLAAHLELLERLGDVLAQLVERRKRTLFGTREGESQ